MNVTVKRVLQIFQTLRKILKTPGNLYALWRGGLIVNQRCSIPVSSFLRFRPLIPKAFRIQPLSFSTKSLIVKIPLNFMCSLFLRPIPLTSSIGISPTISKILSGGITKMPLLLLALSEASLASVLEVSNPIDTGIPTLSASKIGFYVNSNKGF